MAGNNIFSFSKAYSILVTASVILVFLLLAIILYISCFFNSLNPQQVQLFNTCNDLFKIGVGTIFGLISGIITNDVESVE